MGFEINLVIRFNELDLFNLSLEITSMGGWVAGWCFWRKEELTQTNLTRAWFPVFQNKYFKGSPVFQDSLQRFEISLI